MNWNKNCGCNFFEWVEEVDNGYEVDDGHAAAYVNMQAG